MVCMRGQHTKSVRRINQNPSRFRQFLLWFKPSWKMSFAEYVDHYHRLKPWKREKLRELSVPGRDKEKRFAYMAKHYLHIYGPEDNIIDHNALVAGINKLSLPNNSTIASFGAVNMHHEAFLAKEFPNIREIIGVEPLDEMRRQTGRVALNILGLKGRKKIKNTSGTFENSTIKAGSVDCVISNEAFHHATNPENALKHMISRLKIGGGIVIVYRPQYKTNPPTPGKIVEMMSVMGVEIIENMPIRQDPKEHSNNIQLIVGRKTRLKT